MLHPEWSYQAVIYEMNVRQLTPEGTLRAAAGRLPFLKELGIEGDYEGVGHCILGYADGEPKPAAPRKPDYVHYIR